MLSLPDTTSLSQGQTSQFFLGEISIQDLADGLVNEDIELPDGSKLRWRAASMLSGLPKIEPQLLGRSFGSSQDATDFARMTGLVSYMANDRLNEFQIAEIRPEVQLSLSNGVQYAILPTIIYLTPYDFETNRFGVYLPTTISASLSSGQDAKFYIYSSFGNRFQNQVPSVRFVDFDRGVSESHSDSRGLVLRISAGEAESLSLQMKQMNERVWPHGFPSVLRPATRRGWERESFGWAIQGFCVVELHSGGGRLLQVSAFRTNSSEVRNPSTYGRDQLQLVEKMEVAIPATLKTLFLIDEQSNLPRYLWEF